MSFDLSRISFDPSNNFWGVLMQQGRVQLDADWNEWVAQIARRIQAETLDNLGPAAVPRETPDGFRIRLDGGVLTIGQGRIYVDGLLAENHGVAPMRWNPALAESTGAGTLSFYTQPYLPFNASIQPASGDSFNRPELGSGPYLVYLDVWQRELTYLQEPELVEKAVGVDTTGRLQTVWQVRLIGGIGDSVPADWTSSLQGSSGRLTTATENVLGDVNPCVIPPSAGYKGLENQLYRVEIHQGGALGTATFKWSRDNATVATRVTEIQSGNRLVVESIGRDEILGFHPGDWIEILDDWHELHGKPGLLRRIRPGEVDKATRSIMIEDPLPSGLFPVDGQGHTDASRNTRIRRWDQSGNVRKSDGTVFLDLNASASSSGIPVPASGTQLVLENGILVAFDPGDGGGFNAGDYWVFAARSVDASIEILNRAPPLGIHHHYAPLALLRFPDEVIDQRTPYNPLTGTVQVFSVLQVDADGRNRSVHPGREIPVNLLAEGLSVLIRERVHPDSVNDGSLLVTSEIPFHLPAAYGGGPNGLVVAYQPVVLPAEVGLADNGILSWQPFAQTTAFLADILQHDVPRLGNVRFEREFEVFDNGGPPSQWALTEGNVLIQTHENAGTTADPQTSVLPTMAVHRYRINKNPAYVGLTVDGSERGSVGLVYNWLSPNDFSLFVGRVVWVPVGYSGAYPTLVMSHVQIKGGNIVEGTQKDQTVSAYSSSGPRRIDFNIKTTNNQLQFGCNADFDNYGGSVYTVNVPSLDFPPVAELIPGSRLGVLTAGTGTARFTRLQVVYGNDSPVTLIPAGFSSRLLSRLVLKRSLLEVTGKDGASPDGVFAAPLPEPDFETWFWLVPPTPGYYGYGYGQGGVYQGIGAARLLMMAGQQ